MDRSLSIHTLCMQCMLKVRLTFCIVEDSSRFNVVLRSISSSAYLPKITLEKENVNGTSHSGQLYSCQTYIKLSSLLSWPVYFTFFFSKVILVNRQSK